MEKANRNILYRIERYQTWNHFSWRNGFVMTACMFSMFSPYLVCYLKKRKNKWFLTCVLVLWLLSEKLNLNKLHPPQMMGTPSKLFSKTYRLSVVQLNLQSTFVIADVVIAALIVIGANRSWRSMEYKWFFGMVLWSSSSIGNAKRRLYHKQFTFLVELIRETLKCN